MSLETVTKTAFKRKLREFDWAWSLKRDPYHLVLRHLTEYGANAVPLSWFQETIREVLTSSSVYSGRRNIDYEQKYCELQYYRGLLAYKKRHKEKKAIIDALRAHVKQLAESIPAHERH